MKKPFFNLIDEPWIKVIMADGKEAMVSLNDVFEKGSEIRTIAGETALQDNAVLRLLIAISVTCFYRYDDMGLEASLTDSDEAIERFRKIWEQGKFPKEFIGKYLDKWHDKFFLIGGAYPFYQVPDKYVKEISVKKDKKNPNGMTYSLSPHRTWDRLGWISAMSFNGEVLQSANTISPFTNKGNEEKNKLSYDEAARWLLYYMNYADCSTKIPGKWNAGMTYSSSGANIHPIGINLFETIMLCSVLLDINSQLYPGVAPAWEKSECEEYTEINASPYGDTAPDNIPELYTQQSRKVILHQGYNCIDGMYTAAGDKYGTTNSFIEPMFAFHVDKSDKTGNTRKPNHLKPKCTGWKEYKSIFLNGSLNPARWVNVLYEHDILTLDGHIPFVMNDIAYGSMQCGVDYTVSTYITATSKYYIDSLSMERAEEEINIITEISGILKQFGQNIDLAYGAKRDNKGRLESSIGDKMVEEYELYAGKLIEQLLADKIENIDEIHRKEIKKAWEVADRVLNGVNILGFIGHGDQNIGVAENKLVREIYDMKKKLAI